WDAAETLGIIAQRRLIAPDLVRMAVAAGDRDLAERVTDAAIETAHLCSAPSAQGAALRCQGHLEASADLLLESVEAQRKGPRLLERAATTEEAGAALAAAGRKSEATECLNEALSLYRECGASQERRRVESALRDLGVSSGSRGKRQRPTVGWEALTKTELAVTRLAAE